MRRNGYALNIEIKPTPSTEEHTGRAVAQHAARLWSGNVTPPLLSSFRPGSLLGAREGAAHLPRALLLDSLWPAWLDVARTLGCVAVVARHTLIDTAFVDALRDAGLRSLAYTVNDAYEARQLLDLGFDGLITDAVDRFAPAAD